jgi:hypothetical protein
MAQQDNEMDGNKPAGGIRELRLNTLENTRKSFARVIREFHAGRMEAGHARTLTYMLSHFLGYWKLEKEMQIEQRLEAVEQVLQERNG